jgi:hypothetical protein
MPEHDQNEHDYHNGLRDGKITSLERAVDALTIDVGKLKVAIWMLYGAIALVQFLPELRGFLSGGT